MGAISKNDESQNKNRRPLRQCARRKNWSPVPDMTESPHCHSPVSGLTAKQGAQDQQVNEVREPKFNDEDKGNLRFRIKLIKQDSIREENSQDSDFKSSSFSSSDGDSHDQGAR